MTTAEKIFIERAKRMGSFKKVVERDEQLLHLMDTNEKEWDKFVNTLGVKLFHHFNKSD